MKEIFLDLDGTLIDSSRRHLILLEDIVSKYEIKCEHFSDYLEFKCSGFSTKEYLIKRLGFKEEIAIKISNEWIEHIEDEEYVKYDTLYNDTILFLNYLKSKGALIVFITARRNNMLVSRFLSDNNLDIYANRLIVVNPSDAHNEKKMHIESTAKGVAIVVGDTEVDYFCDKKCYLLNRGFRNKTFWDQKGVVSYSSLIDIIEAIDKENLLI